MKQFFYYIMILSSIIIIFLGYLHYGQQLTTVVSDSADHEPELASQDIQEEQTSYELGGLLEEVAKQNEDEEEFLLMVIGSSAVTSVEESSSMPQLLLPQFKSLLASQDVALTVIDVNNATSSEVLADNYIDKIIKNNPDLLVIEPFLLNDYDQLPVEDSLSNLETVMSELEEQLSDTLIVLSPAHPLDDDGYLTFTDKIKAFSAKHEYLYADHWEAWPTVANELPNEQWHRIWSDYLMDFLVN
ncbi:hypothetical protein [Halalkalibacter okhensis]|uniref:SGNH hydrolase-type esterase domain-containing protein n=1 Tax=Halalkalibacter okhensis TaxID=333138 RepID=A0A0B0I8A9_9BACI|nr:hypothetical protein [Halalkalibacter okhensis]KHF38728.1 hypothetical protein LQ50_19395 [Halalkalibacter okhensis]